jgi:hypothetical protein
VIGRQDYHTHNVGSAQHIAWHEQVGIFLVEQTEDRSVAREDEQRAREAGVAHVPSVGVHAPLCGRCVAMRLWYDSPVCPCRHQLTRNTTQSSELIQVPGKGGGGGQTGRCTVGVEWKLANCKVTQSC